MAGSSLQTSTGVRIVSPNWPPISDVLSSMSLTLILGALIWSSSQPNGWHASRAQECFPVQTSSSVTPGSPCRLPCHAMVIFGFSPSGHGLVRVLAKAIPPKCGGGGGMVEMLRVAAGA